MTRMFTGCGFAVMAGKTIRHNSTVIHTSRLECQLVMAIATSIVRNNMPDMLSGR
jgi:hypothetical protein